jgi:hypothetical protein
MARAQIRALESENKRTRNINIKKPKARRKSFYYVANLANNIIDYNQGVNSLECVLEPLFAAFDLNLTPVNLLIIANKFASQTKHNQDNDKLACDTSVEAWVVRRSILLSKDKTADDAANTSESDKCGAAEGSFPVSTNVVCLVCH